MAGMRTGLLSRNRRDGVRHAAHEQDALGADRARRRHRHHVDRRHDVADPRLRQLAARLDQPARARTPSSCRSAARSASRRARASSRWRAARTSRWRTRARSSASARRSRSSTSGSARRATHGRGSIYGNERTKQLGILGATENWAAVNFAKLELGRLFIAGGSRAPPQRRGARQRTRGSRCSPTSIRSARRSASAPTSSPSSACSASGRAPAASRPASTTSPSSRTARTRSSTARC